MARWVRMLAAVAGLMLLAATAALADPSAPGWSRPVVLDASLNAGQPRVAMSVEGEIIVAWTRQGRVLTLQRSTAGSQRTQALWVHAGEPARELLLVASSDGHAALAWTAGGRVHASLWRPGGGFSARPVPDSADPRYLSAAIDANGRTVLVWQAPGGGGPYAPILISWCTVSARRCSPPSRLAAQGTQPRVGVDAAGRATVAWIAGPGERHLRVTTLTPQGAVSFRQRIDLAHAVTGLHLQVGEDGSMVLGWGAADLGNRVARAAFRPGRGRFSKPVTLVSDLVGFAPLITAPVGGQWWTTYQSGAGEPVSLYSGRQRRVADATSAITLGGPIDSFGLAGLNDGGAAIAWETDNSIDATRVDGTGASAPVTKVGPSAGRFPSVGAAPQIAGAGSHLVLVWLERPRYDPLNVSLAGHGRVMLATAS